MFPGKKLSIKKIISMCCLASALLFCSLLFSGCAAYEAVANYFSSTDHFLAFEGRPEVRYEPGAKAFAAAVAAALPGAVEKVEARQFSAFPGRIRVFVCHSRESFKQMTGRDVAGMAYRNRVFLSPKVLERPGTLDAYLAHELSHLHLYQHVGGYGYIGIPSWFAEGLAVAVSDGGGAERVSPDEARRSIVSGNHFLPVETAGIKDLVVPKYASYWDIRHRFKHHMFYRQCMMFVSFLEQETPGPFKRFLTDLETGTEFSRAFRSAFGTTTMAKWDEFLAGIRMKDTRAVAGKRNPAEAAP